MFGHLGTVQSWYELLLHGLIQLILLALIVSLLLGISFDCFLTVILGSLPRNWELSEYFNLVAWIDVQMDMEMDMDMVMRVDVIDLKIDIVQ